MHHQRNPASLPSVRRCLLAAVCVGVFGPAPYAAHAAVRYGAADVTGRIADSQPLEFDVYLPLRDTAGLESLLQGQQNRASPLYHRWLTPAQFGARFGATNDAMQSAAAALTRHGMTVTRYARSLHVTGTAASVREAFAADLAMVRAPSGRERMVSLNRLALSPALEAAGARIFAFSTRKAEARPFSRVVATNLPDNRGSTTGGYYYNDLKQAYSYPAVNALRSGTSTRLDGTGATTGVLMSADVKDADIAKMFSNEGYAATTGRAAPTLYSRVKVDGGSNTSSDAFDEASLDVQMELGGAPGAHVILYQIPELSDQDVMDGYNRINQDNLVDVVSSSFGECEKAYTAADNGGVDDTAILTEEHEIFEQGNSQGITFLASSGDASGKQCPSVSYFNGGTGKFQAGASAPATDPNVTGVGGTNLVTTHTSGSLNSAYSTENAWSDPESPYDPYGLGADVSGGSWGAGGGASIFFATPSWQTSNGAKMRTTPDIGMQVGGCPTIAKQPCNGGNRSVDGNGNTQRSYVEVVLNGSFSGLIGTSVASPEFASAVAIMVELHGRQGNLNPTLYGLRGGSSFHTSIPGYNGIKSNSFPSTTYDYTVGLGTPVTATLIGAPSGTALAGVPHTASNP